MERVSDVAERRASLLQRREMLMSEEMEEYARVRSMDDREIVLEGLDHKDVMVRELANRYDVVCEKLRKQLESVGRTSYAPIKETK